MTAVLKISQLTIETATRTAVNSASLEVPQASIVALLGPNGAGKSELVRGVAGVIPVLSGDVLIDNQSLIGHSVQDIRKAGIAAIPEGHQTLRGLSVQDNLLAAGSTLTDSALTIEVNNAYEVFPELRRLKHKKAGSLSGGQQQMVAISQALVSRPKFLLIDEMSLGLAPVIIDRLVAVIQSLRNKDIGILLIEQFTQLALNIADHCYVLAQGEIHFSGHPDELIADKNILEQAYLGS